ncbi:MAG TPA: hypothetical protein VMT35_12680 [Ignavibacteriaceae bacterium]|nr:hypothetical protein [Ignavibacteriaceae bacterium]
MKRSLLPLLIFFSSAFLFGQVVYQPITDQVYNYLSILSRKGIINLQDLMKPVSRKYIAGKLLEAKNKIDEMTNLEKEELDYYMKDYYLELEAFKKENEGEENASWFGKDPGGRLRLFSYSDNLFKINVSPILGYELNFPGKERESRSWNGLGLYGYLSDNIGFSFDFKLYNEASLEYKTTMNRFTPETGKITATAFSKNFDYSETHAMVTVDWSWGSFSAGKDFLEYGIGESGKLVLSSKAPSFPFLRLNLKPVSWFTFNYFHAWLNSDVVDSVNVLEYRRNIFRDKYFAWHSIIITPFDGFDFSIGESIIYSDRLEFAYLVPIMFFYLADDFVSDRINKPGDANSQIFMAVSSKGNIKNTHLYGTLFIDELTIPNFDNTLFPDGKTLKDGEYERRLRTQLGFTAGASVSDIPLHNLTITAEYTRINPFVYGHHTPAQTYTNASYLMGHWIGHNSDLLYISLDYRVIRGLRTGLWGEYIRKGSEDYSGQYIQPQPPFLFGLRRSFRYIGLNLNYEILHELNASAVLRFNKTSEEQEEGNFVDTDSRVFSVSVYYGL